MPAMTSDRPSDESTRPDTDDWWGGTVDPAPPPADLVDPADTPTGSEGGADRAGGGRSRWLLGAAAVLAVAAIGIGVLVTRDDGGSEAATGESGAGAFGPGGAGGGTGGTITEIDPDTSTLVVTSSTETVEVTATEDTAISETVEGSVDDLATGDSILVVGPAGVGGTIAADQIVAGGDSGLVGGRGPFGGGPPEGGDSPEPPEGGFRDGVPPGGGQPPDGFDPGKGGAPGGFTTGTIAAIGDGSLSVRTADDETVTVTVSSSTTVRLSQELSFDDLATGDEVTVTGQRDDGTVDAVMIRRGDGGFGFGGGFPRGGIDGGDAGDGSAT
jgi:Domain of unknown function (DUF5666)